MLRLFPILCISILIFCLSSCDAGRKFFAPVWDAGATEHIPKSGIYRVKAKETFYAIAWRYGLDYRDLAKRNGIQWPYHIKRGQLLYLRGKLPRSVPRNENISYPGKAYSSYSSPPTRIKYSPELAREPKAQVQFWRWPANGVVVRHFSASNKGINISGQLGNPIFASAAGKVVYSGNGLRGYGNLVIIKHNASFLTAYAYNSRNLVSEGEWVTEGQKIAEMGGVRANKFMLHFEIRRNGQPVNPLYYLGNK